MRRFFNRPRRPQFAPVNGLRAAPQKPINRGCQREHWALNMLEAAKNGQRCSANGMKTGFPISVNRGYRQDTRPLRAENRQFSLGNSRSKIRLTPRRPSAIRYRGGQLQGGFFQGGVRLF